MGFFWGGSSLIRHVVGFFKCPMPVVAWLSCPLEALGKVDFGIYKELSSHLLAPLSFLQLTACVIHFLTMAEQM